jgi:hypothetical protein
MEIISSSIKVLKMQDAIVEQKSIVNAMHLSAMVRKLFSVLMVSRWYKHFRPVYIPKSPEIMNCQQTKKHQQRMHPYNPLNEFSKASGWYLKILKTSNCQKKVPLPAYVVWICEH